MQEKPADWLGVNGCSYISAFGMKIVELIDPIAWKFYPKLSFSRKPIYLKFAGDNISKG